MSSECSARMFEKGASSDKPWVSASGVRTEIATKAVTWLREGLLAPFVVAHITSNYRWRFPQNNHVRRQGLIEQNIRRCNSITNEAKP